MLDSHAHLNLDPLVDDYQSYIKLSLESGVDRILIPGVNFKSSLKAIEIAIKYSHINAAIGLHPHEAEQVLSTKSTQDILRWLIETGSNPQVVAIGECGLDYFRLPEDPLEQKHAKAAQKKLFKLHIKTSLELNKPLLIHVREAQTDALELLETYKPRAVLHCFSGDKAYLTKALALGCYISFAGNITFAKANDLQGLIKLVPLDRLLLETDAPFLNPNRGQWPNTPTHIKKTYEFVANYVGIPENQLSIQIEKNYQKFLNLN